MRKMRKKQSMTIFEHITLFFSLCFVDICEIENLKNVNLNSDHISQNIYNMTY